jgi:co-chaperonin GroES (HSP10)
MPYMMMKHDVDPKQKLLDDLGDISELEIFNNQILLAVYIRPQQTRSGLHLASQTTDEDRYQSKVGLLVKSGNAAFKDDTDTWFKDIEINEEDWILFRPSDGWSITINGVLCRMLEDVSTKGRIPHPDMAY